MAQLLSSNQLKLDNGSTITPEQGGWYDGRRFMDGQLLNPGEYEPGKMTSNATIAQTNPNNVSYIQGKVSASRIQAPSQVPYTSNSTQSYVGGLEEQVRRARKALDSNLNERQERNTAQMAELRKIEKETLDKVEKLATPFREEIETQQREELFINKNFQENQKLVDELDQLLTEGNTLIREQQSVTGLSAIRNPRVQQTMNDIAARAGVIQAVMSARNGQIAQAYTMIDRTVSAIAQDRQDQLNYYETILNLTNRDILMVDAESKTIAQERVNLLKNDLQQAQETSNYVKQLMINPATASLMGEAGVSLGDSIETINAKISEAEYTREVRQMTNEYAAEGAQPITSSAGVPQNRLRTFVDSRGVTHYYKLPPKTSTGYTSSSAANSWLDVGGGQTDTVESSAPSSEFIDDVNGLRTPSMQQVEIDLSSIFQDVIFGRDVASSAASASLGQ